MHIRITRRIFTEDPSKRFSRVFKCPSDLWRNVWKKYKLLGYTEEEAYEYLIYALRQPVRRERFKRWINRTELYSKAQVAINKGAEEVKHDYFGNLTDFLIRELKKNS